jgi:pyruvate formate lyase activating enzyme
MVSRLVELLDELTAPGELVEKLADDGLRCTACAHRCRIRPGRRGICQVRFNQDGELRVPWGYVAGVQSDPIEKKPFYHLLPGSDALTFGMLGCNFHCDFCQNWLTSQALRDPKAVVNPDIIQRISPEQLVAYALYHGAGVIVSSYNEPLITTEWALEIFRTARQARLRTAYVSNGNATPEVLKALQPFLSACKIDLKTMQDKNYRLLGGRLKPILDTITMASALGLWVEVVTLVIPGFNDSPEELWDAARFLASVSPDIPWHVTAYHPDYQRNAPSTSAASLQQAADIGQEAGLRHVYAGNLPGRVGSLENTYCHSCKTLLIQRRGFTVKSYTITPQGTCPKCKLPIAGIWTDKPELAHIEGLGVPKRVNL